MNVKITGVRQTLDITDRIRGLYHHRIYKLKYRLNRCNKREDITLLEWTTLEGIVRTNNIKRASRYLDYLASKDMRTWWDKLLLRKPIYRDI